MKRGRHQNEFASGEAPGVGVGPGSGCTLKQVKAALRDFEKRHGMANGHWARKVNGYRPKFLPELGEEDVGFSIS